VVFRTFSSENLSVILSVRVDVDGDLAAVGELAEKELVRERAPRIVSWMRRDIGRAPMFGSSRAWRGASRKLVGEHRFDFLLLQLRFELHQEFVDDAQE